MTYPNMEAKAHEAPERVTFWYYRDSQGRIEAQPRLEPPHPEALLRDRYEPIEYVRADIARSVAAEARKEALEEAALGLENDANIYDGAPFGGPEKNAAQAMAMACRTGAKSIRALAGRKEGT